MGRTAQVLKLKYIVPVAVLVVAGIGLDIWSHTANAPSKTASVSSVTHKSSNRIVYPGVEGKDALTLLKKRAKVEVKHYSFGDQVISINGVKGSGPKYWTFYVNGKTSNVGAGSYVTKKGDKLEWKLQ